MLLFPVDVLELPCHYPSCFEQTCGCFVEGCGPVTDRSPDNGGADVLCFP
jgi:hypothetical protein